MKSSNVKHPLECKHVQMADLTVNGVKIPIYAEIIAPADRLYLVATDREGNEIRKVLLLHDGLKEYK